MSLDDLVQRSIKNLDHKHIFKDTSRGVDIIIVKIYPRIGLGYGGQEKRFALLLKIVLEITLFVIAQALFHILTSIKK